MREDMAEDVDWFVEVDVEGTELSCSALRWKEVFGVWFEIGLGIAFSRWVFGA
jgi:hypothetical protein